MAKRKQAPKEDPWPRVYEGFRDPSWELKRWSENVAPRCWNGDVSVRRYRVTAEIIDEPIEVIHERLRKLWAESDNHHHFGPIKSAAAKVGLELDHDTFGAWTRNRKTKDAKP